VQQSPLQHELSTTRHEVIITVQRLEEPEIWCRAQHEAARRCKSNWGDNLGEGGLKFRS